MIFQTTVDYRRRAAECLARAEIAKDFVAKEQWNLFAKHWQHLADKGGSNKAMIRDSKTK